MQGDSDKVEIHYTSDRFDFKTMSQVEGVYTES